MVSGNRHKQARLLQKGIGAKTHEITLGSEGDSLLHKLLAVQHAQGLCKLKTDKNLSKDVVMGHKATSPVKELCAIDK